MRIAYLLFAYRNPKLIAATVERLSCKDSAFFVHIDLKSELSQFAQIQGDNIHFSEQRLPVYWAEFSGVEAILLLIRQALKHPLRYDYLVLLSGSEYPLRSRDYIHNFLDVNRGTEFITLVKMPNPEAGKPLSRINTLRIPSRQPVYRLIVRMLAKAGLAQRDYRKYLGELDAYAGNTWWAVTAEAGRHILGFHDRQPHVARFFEGVFAPEEMFFHTILGNSEFRARLRRNLVYEDWSAGGARPATINETHLAAFEAQEQISVQDIHGPGELLFARKISDAELGLTLRIDEMIKRHEQRRLSPNVKAACQA